MSDPISRIPVVRTIVEQAKPYTPPGERRPLAGYLVLMSSYSAFVAGASLLARATGHPLPTDIRVKDVALCALATHKLTRIITKDSITSPLRAPFTRYKEPGGPAELVEEVRDDEGVLKHAAGELITCPFCLGVWTSTSLATGLIFAPRATRVAAGVFATVAVADFLHFAYVAAEKAAEG
jgi:hypothetical protein